MLTATKWIFYWSNILVRCAPPGFHDKQVTFEDCANALEPVIGEVGMHTPKWLEPLDECLKEIEQCQSIRELLGKGILDETRLLKVSSGEMYFGPTALVAITRFNFLARRGFVRMIAADLHAIRSTLRELEVLGITNVDCSKAGLSNQESIAHLRDICKEWKKAFHAAYAAGQSFKQLVDVRTIVEERLNQALGQKLQHEEQEKAQAEAAAQRDAEERARVEAEAQAKREAEEQARFQAEERARREAEEHARLQTEEQARRETEERARLESEERARQEGEEKVRKEAEEAARQKAEREWLEAEAKAKREKEEAEAKAKREHEEAEHLDEYERALREAEEQEKLGAEAKARQAREAAEHAKREAEEKSRLEEEERKRKEKEKYEKEFARLEAEENARKEAEVKAAQETEERASKQAEGSRPKTAEELELEAYEAAIKAAEGTTGAPAPVISAGAGTAAAPAPSAGEVETYRAQIEEQIKSLGPRDGAVATVALGPLKLLLSSWEVSAYATGKDVTAEILQRAVAARAVLLVAIDQRKYSGNSEQLRSALWQVQVESEKIQARVGIAKDAKDLDAACNLAATSKRLMSLVDEAEKLK